MRCGLALTRRSSCCDRSTVYGDPAPWASQASGALTLVSFLNVTKYPPSLLFLLMTLGPALLSCVRWTAGRPRCCGPALVFGRVPLFYFVLHLTLIHLLAVVLCYVQNGAAHWMFESPNLGAYPFTPPPGWGVSLPVDVSALAAGRRDAVSDLRVVRSVRQRRTGWWLSYL